jgi:signal transduction histidine kinase
MSSRAKGVIALVAILVALVALAVGLTTQIRSAQRAARDAEQHATAEAYTRLAVYRMDSIVAGVLAAEAARSIDLYTKSTVPAAEAKRVIAVFEVDVAGHVTTSLGGEDRQRELAAIVAALPPAPKPPPPLPPTPIVIEAPVITHEATNAADLQQRMEKHVIMRPAPPLAPSRSFGPLEARFVHGELVLARRAPGRMQGVWLDWPALSAELLAATRDLLPDATLTAAPGDTPLAAIPASLVPGSPAAIAGGARVGWALVALWIGVVLAAIAACAVLVGVVRLAARREAFAHAVTHELRTPLTTVQTYAEMLASGQLDATQTATYLETLSREAARLGRLVENVLAYARLGAGRKLDLVSLDARRVLERITPRLEARAAEARMRLEIAPDDAPLGFRGDEVAVEQILFNIVDNACKYAAGAGDRRIIVEAGRTGAEVVLSVSDFGPGVPEEQARTLFTPFDPAPHASHAARLTRRAAPRPASSAPGIGLGLALCRRLAHEMHGELTLHREQDRTVVRLAVPSA